MTAAGTRSRGWAPTVPDVIERCVQVEAADGVLLPGVLITPAHDQADVCVVWLPGFGLGPDYGPYLDIGRQLAAGGVAFAAVAVRGYHGAVTAWRRATGRWCWPGTVSAPSRRCTTWPAGTARSTGWCSPRPASA